MSGDSFAHFTPSRHLESQVILAKADSREMRWSPNSLHLCAYVISAWVFGILACSKQKSDGASNDAKDPGAPEGTVVDDSSHSKLDSQIRVAYFVPADRQPTSNYEKKIKVLLQFVSDLYKTDLISKGYTTEGLKFQLIGNDPVVHLLRGKSEAAVYNGAPNYDSLIQWSKIIEEIPVEVGTPQSNVIIIFAETYDPDGSAPIEFNGGVALGLRFSTKGGIGLFSAWILRDEFCATSFDEQKARFFDVTPVAGRTALGSGQPNSPRFEFIEDGFGAVAHELGHAFGLSHELRRDSLDIMANGFRNLRVNYKADTKQEDRVGFSPDNARLLLSSRYLGSNLDLDDHLPPTIDASLDSLKAGDTTLKVSVSALDDRSLHSVVIYENQHDTVVAGRELTGTAATFSDNIPIATLKPGNLIVKIMVSDSGGNLTTKEISTVVAP